MSKDLKKRGFNFVGSTICYAFMQATGMVNDHAVDCFRYRLKGSGQAVSSVPSNPKRG
jgi:3-methyladenine DNA glycosylase Tag